MFDPWSNMLHEGMRARGWWGGRAQTKMDTGERPLDDRSNISLAGISAPARGLA
jgi:hypothetical protein